MSNERQGCLVVSDDGSGNFTAIQVPTTKLLLAIREALPYFEEHLVEKERIALSAYPDTSLAEDGDEGT